MLSSGRERVGVKAQAAGSASVRSRGTHPAGECALLAVNVAGAEQTSVKGMGEGRARERCVSTLWLLRSEILSGVQITGIR